jgi:hypothetical protein
VYLCLLRVTYAQVYLVYLARNPILSIHTNIIYTRMYIPTVLEKLDRTATLKEVYSIYSSEVLYTYIIEVRPDVQGTSMYTCEVQLYIHVYLGGTSTTMRYIFIYTNNVKLHLRTPYM